MNNKNNMETNNKYRDWEILEEMPCGWVEDKYAGSPAANCVFITNGMSVISGKQKRALLRIKKQDIIINEQKERSFIKELKERAQSQHKNNHYTNPSKEINILARERMKLKLLNDVMVDIQICKLEGWDAKEYLEELKNLINTIGNKE